MLNTHVTRQARDSACTLDLDLSAIPAKGGQSRCIPGDDQQGHMFHWLVFVAAPPKGKDAVSAACDLWRWHKGEWRSVFVPGAKFTPEEMHEQGWRYCAPSVQVFVNIHSGPRESRCDAARPDARPKHPGPNASVVIPPRRNHTLAVLPQAALPRQAAAWRRAAIGSV